MNKTTKTNTMKELNNYFEQMSEAGLTDFTVSCNYNKKTDEFMFSSKYDEDHTFNIVGSFDDMDLYTLLKELIARVYDDEINWRNKTVKSYNAFLRRKAKSLSLWSNRNNDIKVNRIVTEIAEMTNKVEENKNEVSEWKDLVRLLFGAIDKFCMDEKLKIAQQKCEEKINQLQKLKNTSDVIFVR